MLRRPALQLEALEDRQLLAASLFASLNNGELYIEGTESADTIRVAQTSTAITVEGLNGSWSPSQVQKIRIFGLGGNDNINLSISGKVVTKPTFVYGGGDHDSIIGGDGNDYLDGGTGNDYIEGRGGIDFLAGDTGSDTIHGGYGNDILVGGSGDDFLYGGSGADILDGGAGYDTLQGGTGTDSIYDTLSDNAINDSSMIRYYHSSYYGWTDAKMTDAIMRRYARTAMADVTVTRDEMIHLLRKAAGNGVSTNEFNDLRLFTASNDINMPTYVRQLAQKVMYPETANAWWTDGEHERVALGNLQAGSSEQHMNRLTDKWFMGSDLPMAQNKGKTIQYDYALAQGSLFQNGISYTDIKQGGISNCYFLASLSATARQQPTRIANMFLDNGDGTYTVKLHTSNNQVNYVTVNGYLPVNSDDKLVFASKGSLVTDSRNELWVALAEKAYAQMNESNSIGQDGTNSYNGIGDPDAPGSGLNNGGYAGLVHASGLLVNSGNISTLNSAMLKNSLTNGQMVTMISYGEQSDPNVVANHAYALVGYNSKTNKFKLYNPHGSGGSRPEHLELSFADLYVRFSGWGMTQL